MHARNGHDAHEERYNSFDESFFEEVSSHLIMLILDRMSLSE